MFFVSRSRPYRSARDADRVVVEHAATEVNR
jgi:hypothetical protein